MFSLRIVDSDEFLDMPLSTQALYFHLSMRADDEGFINNPKKIRRMIGASEDDLKLLVAKSYLIAFSTGVVAIKHWKVHNYIRRDRLIETNCKEEKELLGVKDTGEYFLNDIEEISKLPEDYRKEAYKNSSLPYSFTYKMRRAFEGKECPICRSRMTANLEKLMPTIQHNKPISKGGKHELNNISIICLSCNSSIKDNETDELNNKEVIEIWDKITIAEKNKIDWFSKPSILDEVSSLGNCQAYDGHMSDICPHRLGKDRLGKDNIYINTNSAPDGAQCAQMHTDSEQTEPVTVISQEEDTQTAGASDNSYTHSVTASDGECTHAHVQNQNAHMHNVQADALFERLWKLYPNKKGKARVSDKTKRMLYDYGEEQLKRCIDRYLDGLRVDEWRKPQNGSTFFTSGYVDYLDENYEGLNGNATARGNPETSWSSDINWGEI